MNAFESELTRRLKPVCEQGLHRRLRRLDSPQGPRIVLEGRTFLNFSSNDYLGLSNEPILKEAALHAVEKFGAGAGASRLISGSLAPHAELDEAVAAFKGTEAALSFSTGYAAALGTICALLGRNDIIVIDKLVHASIVDAARLSGAKLRVFAHNDLNELEDILKWARNKCATMISPATELDASEFAGRFPSGRSAQILIVTESLFSMDGDQAPLLEMVELKDRYGAWLMVDEAHATGLYGANRRGLAEALGVGDRIEVQMGTLGKALGAAGGYICGGRALIEYLVNHARSLIFSTAPVPAAAAAATAGLRFVQSNVGVERCAALWERIGQLHGTPAPNSMTTPFSAIIPLIVGAESKAVETAAALRSAGIFIPAIRYPTVSRGAARLRLSLTAAHSADDTVQLLTALKSLQLDGFLQSRTPAFA